MKFSLSKGTVRLGEGAYRQRTSVSLQISEGGREADGVAKDSCF